MARRPRTVSECQLDPPFGTDPPRRWKPKTWYCLACRRPYHRPPSFSARVGLRDHLEARHVALLTAWAASQDPRMSACVYCNKPFKSLFHVMCHSQWRHPDYNNDVSIRFLEIFRQDTVASE